MSKVIVISASGVKNLELANSFHEKLTSLGAKVKVLNLLDLNLPIYTSLTDPLHEGKELLGPWYDELLSTQAFVFVSPEYNGGTPPVFSNFLAWVSRSSKNWRECFNGKSAAIATHSGGGGFQVLMMMRMQLSFIGLNVLGRQIITHSAKALDDASLTAVCTQLLTLSDS